MSRIGNQDSPDLDDIDVLTGNRFGFEGDLDLAVDFYGEGPVSQFLEHISKSRIKTIMKCEREFANKYLAGERTDSNFYMDRGNAVHDAFEEFHQALEAYVVANGEPPHNFTDLMGPASNWFQHLEFIAPFFEWELKRLRTARENTDSEEEALAAWTPHSVEVSLTIDDPPVGEIPWLGPYDCLVDARSIAEIESNEGYVVIDYKTGSIDDKEEWKEEGIYVDLEFYAWMLEEAGFEVAGGIGMYPSEDSNVARSMPNERTRQNITEAVEFLHSVSATRTNFPTQPQPLCDWCHYQDQCPSSW